MGCDRFDQLLSENNAGENGDEGGLRLHAESCRDCREYLLLTKLLASQKENLEKAPETILFKVRQRIHDRRNRRDLSSILDILRPLAKPAIAFSSLLLVAAVFLYLKNSPVGVVDNLADRFNISEYKNIQTGDVLYVGKQINVGLTLNGTVKLGLDSNTVLQVRGKNKIALFRGQVRIAAGKKTMSVETQNGLITLKNATIKVQTTLTKDTGNFRARTSCYVFDGNAQVETKEKVLVTPGQEIVLADNGTVELKKSLSSAAQKGQEFRIDSPVKDKVFTAKEQLCDCLFDMRYDPDHNPLHGKEIKENKFPVRIFWQNKEKIESMRRFDETFCFFNASGYRGRIIDNGPGI